MAKLNQIRSIGSMSKLPPGFVFEPTDEEILFEYLRRKIFALPLPASIVPELIALSNYDPWDLPGDGEEARYFFSNLDGASNAVVRATSCGYWKAQGVPKQISPSSSDAHNRMIMGMKKTLVFFRGRPPHGSRTSWVMHEYCLLPAPSAARAPQLNSWVGELGRWVLCRVFATRASSSSSSDFTSMDVLSSSSSSNSSVTEDSSSSLDEEQTSERFGW
ncbi:NAC domain-containing protein 83 [Rhodamnia argentea]|uniref:NAC domain-containing protein 83 n=1 Tax=Rhodamnia argentea TaxID=178133 RepID=A0A8B8Q5J5_9MYRT|nr:NAC domain-containing protein 83 [Rhodamnia argentea]